jgi:hypothetical protein
LEQFIPVTMSLGLTFGGMGLLPLRSGGMSLCYRV